MEECDNVLDILKKYEEASGQKMNRSKTFLFFSKSIQEEVKHSIKMALGVPEILHHEEYLGLPSLVGKGKKESFNYIKEKVWRKLQGWEAKLLSQAGMEVLLKAIIQATLTYTMGCFKLPLDDRRKIHWVKLEEMTKSKTIGGVGVVIRDNNGAVLPSCSEKIIQAYKAEEIEALAALKALMFAHELSFQNVILEGDALGLIQALK
ncbi:uncharacterized protein LOC126728358 [Quercus robur]|uniref:uncharacterized protein LOC126728358 n=1 Tax=Quercus robur TaxID=38942 RepID=UPI002163F106|nr:uncharacterized protein LOC126728358 [Quercus robur]